MRRKWLVPSIWAAILIVSCVTQAYIAVADDARRGVVTLFSRSFAVQASSHLVLAALIPAVYGMLRHFPLTRPRNLAVHAVALVMFSVAHTLGMGALRMLWFAGILGDASFRFPITFDRLLYEFTKDIFTYCVMNLGVMAFRYLRDREGSVAPAPISEVPPERFAVRKLGGSEVVVEVAWSAVNFKDAMVPRSTGSKLRATTPSCMSAARPSRSAPPSPGWKANSIPNASCGSTSHTS